MNYTRLQGNRRSFIFCSALTGLMSVAAIPLCLNAQNPEIQARLAGVKESMARNKQQLAHYSWTEQDIISLKGEEKKEELFQVQLGPRRQATENQLGSKCNV